MPFRPIHHFKPIQVHRKKLPHWRQEGVTYFVTSRLADSVPARALAEWHADRASWLRQHGMTDLSELSGQPEDIQQDYHRTFTSRFHELLDAGHGACHLLEPDLAGILASLFARSHGSACDLDAWVIMPNHFHALVRPMDGVALGKITQSWKGVSAREINRKLGCSGRLWQPEGFDHFVRSEAHLQRFRKYVAENPAKAGLRMGFVLGVGTDSGLTKEEVLTRFGLG